MSEQASNPIRELLLDLVSTVRPVAEVSSHRDKGRSCAARGPADAAPVVRTLVRLRWQAPVQAVRDRIKEMRKRLVEKIHARAPGSDFSFVLQQRGMFSYSGLTKEQAVERFAWFFGYQNREAFARDPRLVWDHACQDGGYGDARRGEAAAPSGDRSRRAGTAGSGSSRCSGST